MAVRSRSLCRPDMDLREYFQKIRKLEAEIEEPFVVVVSRTTPDGGKAGVLTDVPRVLAAKMIADEKADLASAEDAAKFRAETARQHREAVDADMPPAGEVKPARRRRDAADRR